MKWPHPPAWAWLAVIAAVALFSVLGTWQLRRGLHKQEWLEQFADESRPAVVLDGGTSAPDATPRRATAKGVYLVDRQLLADGQSHAQRPGYHVWTPLRLATGGVVLVNRGWVPQPPPAALPAPAGDVVVEGYWRSLPEPGLRTDAGACRRAETLPVVVVYPTAGQVGCLLGETVSDGILLLDPSAPGGYVREWAATGVAPQRHFGYALQWYALGLTAAVLFVILNVRRQP